MTRENYLRLIDLMAHISEMRHYGSVLWKPIVGGAFGATGHSIGSSFGERDGLWAVTFFVRHDASRMILGGGCDTKADALQAARQDIAHWGARLPGMQADVAARLVERHDAAREAWLSRFISRPKEPQVPRRRRDIFDRSGGKCHYCQAALTLDGKWHIEHKMPRALFGGSEQANLVASCVSCNLRKKDKTDMEFMAQQQSEAA
jgi:hypothetical protein